MFGPSVKSVPGWWVSIVPTLIGVPVALTPGLGPHEEIGTEPPLEPPPLELLEAAGAADELLAPLPPAAPLLLELLLLPHAARTTAAMTAHRTTNRRMNLSS